MRWPRPFGRRSKPGPSAVCPANPEAWLLTTARNRQLDVYRSAAARSSVPLIDEEVEAVLVSDVDPDAIPDDRMKLLFVCAHPAHRTGHAGTA